MTRGRFLFVLACIGALVAAVETLRSPDVSAAVVAASMLATTLRFATPLTLGALAGMFCERSGVANIAIEGMMLSAAFGAFIVAAMTRSLAAGVVAGMVVGATMALLHAWLSVTLRVDQIVSGTVINIMAAGVTGFLSTEVVRRKAIEGAGLLPAWRVPVLSDLPVVGPIFQQQPIAWATLALVIGAHFVLFRTVWGLRVRAVGELPRAAHAAGISVQQTRYAAVMVGGAIAGIGGAYFTLEAVPVFEPMMTNGRGFIALAALIFGGWTPAGAWVASLLFAAANALHINAQQFGIPVPSQIVGMFPYVLTIVILAGAIGRVTPPAAVGQPYVPD